MLRPVCVNWKLAERVFDGKLGQTCGADPRSNVWFESNPIEHRVFPPSVRRVLLKFSDEQYRELLSLIRAETICSLNIFFYFNVDFGKAIAGIWKCSFWKGWIAIPLPASLMNVFLT